LCSAGQGWPTFIGQPCQTHAQAQAALTFVRQVLEGELGLALSAEKTKITTFGLGFEFLGYYPGLPDEKVGQPWAALHNAFSVAAR